MKPGSDNMEENITKFSEIPSLTIDDIVNYGTSSYIKEYYYTYNVSMNSSNITKASSSIDDNRSSEFSNRGFDRKNSIDFTVVGYSTYSAMEDFISGEYFIIDVEVSEDFSSSNCVINKELATLNELVVGNAITLTNPNDSTLTYDVVISGIYSEISNEENMDMFSKSVNTIITNNNVVNTILLGDTL